MKLRALLPAVILALIVGAGSAKAQDGTRNPAPETAGERVILTVDGNLADGAPVDFTRSELEALGVEREETSTPWFDDVVVFEGVRLSRVLDHVGAQGRTLVATALNEYYAEIPLSDARDHDVLIALKANGAYMSVRDKGPLFVIYPFDRKPELENELFYTKSVWQLRRLTVK
ncbi:molybdopterin-dependent oxidoreductase [Stappia sp.]|uniref:molybdopterin-dependent oxidoreductase n=1 Tax=Stappia sp. TaxID=1870903 RepID=UPI0032D8B5F6